MNEQTAAALIAFVQARTLGGTVQSLDLLTRIRALTSHPKGGTKRHNLVAISGVPVLVGR